MAGFFRHDPYAEQDTSVYVNTHSGGGRPGRYRPQPRYDYDYDEPQYIQVPQGRHRQSHSNAGQPAQIIIENKNYMDDHHEPQPVYYPPPVQRVQQPPQVIYDQQIVVQERRDRHDRYDRERYDRDRYDRERHDRDELSYESRRNRDELMRLQHEKEEKEAYAKAKKDIELKQAEEEKEAREQAEKEKKAAAKAVEEWKAKQEKEAREKKEKEEEKERIGKEYMRQQLLKDGYTEEAIEDFMEQRANKKKKRAKSPDIVSSSTSIVIKNQQPTHMRVNKKHIAPETLDHYGYDWDWAEDGGGMIIIHQWISEADREVLLEHTDKLKEKKLIQFAEVEQITVKGIQKGRDGKLLMVRKKEEKRGRSKSPGVIKRFYLG